MSKNIRFSSIVDFFKKNVNELAYVMEVPFTDTYQVKFNKLASVELLDENNNQIIKENSSFKVNLNKGDIVKVILSKDKSNNAKIVVTPIHHKALLPYEPYNQINTRKLRTHGNNDVDPLAPAELFYIKRDDGNGLYINCNNPEKLTKDDIGNALTRQDISNKKVFFTFEHNNYEEPFYYGYQVKNTSKKDIYVTILNMGFHIDGPGCWLGEKEWVDFYNANFRYDPSNWTLKQKEEFAAFYNFTNSYKTKKLQPTTYKIPAGKYIYIVGGTTKDAYKHINVFNTANKLIKSGCSNVAALFEIVGEAEGAFFVYQDPKQIKNNNTHQGYVTLRNDHQYGVQYEGYDNCHGVVDCNILWTFNDKTPAMDLPVKYTNYYDDNIGEKYPYKKLNSTPHVQNKTEWITHINPQDHHDGIGTDMTYYYCVKHEDKTPVCISSDYLDGRGEIANIGNWMMDYMDYYTFVNQGDNDREITIKMKCNGSICVLLRDKNGKLIKGSEKFAIYHKGSSPELDIFQPFEHKMKVKAHSIVQIIVEYNLLANSCGYVPHVVTLK